jgi:hypothetical protein
MKQVISMRGQKVDMVRLITNNEHKVAVGNAHRNARGDKVSADGAVLMTREQLLSDYNKSNPKAVKHVGLNSIAQEVLSPAQAAAHNRTKATESKADASPPAAPRRRLSETET